MRGSNPDRITSRIYIACAMGSLFGLISLLIGFFSEHQNRTFTLIFIALMICVALSLYFFCNFIDIYFEPPNTYSAKQLGKTIQISDVKKIKYLPGGPRLSSQNYVFGYLVFCDENEKRRIKFVAVEAEKWDDLCKILYGQKK